MLVIENLVPKSYQNEIEDVLKNVNFPWFLYETLVNEYNEVKNENTNVTNAFGLTHTLYEPNTGVNSNYYSFFKPILYFMEEKTDIEVQSVLRIRIRKTMPTIGHDNTKYNPPHVDLPEVNPYKTLVYYVDDTDGDTILFNEFYIPGSDINKQQVTEYKRNTPKKGNAVLFDGHRYHSGNNPINYSTRTIINFDFFAR